MRWLLWLARLPARMVVGYVRELGTMRAWKAEGRCVICGAPAEGSEFCREHRLDAMAAP